MKHTPTPWKRKDAYRYLIVNSETENFICEMRGLDSFEMIANAEHIVKCVNSHDALLELLKDILGFIYHGHHALHTTTESHEYIEKIEKAIQKAEGK